MAAALCSPIACTHSLGPLPSPITRTNALFRSPTALVRSVENDIFPSVSPQGELVFASATGGQLDIYSRRLADGRLTQLTTAPTNDRDPTISKDGRRIAWVAQSNDIQGDVWIMDSDGSDKERLTDREAAESAPVFSVDGRFVYFTVQPPSIMAPPRIDRIDLDTHLRSTVVTHGWDASVTASYIFYVAPENGVPKIFARSLIKTSATARRVSAAPGAEGMPRAFARHNKTYVLHTRFADDTSGDGFADSEDAASLWIIAFDDAPTMAPARPLSTGEKNEIFANISPDGTWLTFTAQGSADLDVYALPIGGTINPNATARDVLRAARTQRPALRRMAWRHVIATEKSLEAEARYRLARDFALDSRHSDALSELNYVAQLDHKLFSPLAKIEILREKLMQSLGRQLQARTATQRTVLSEVAAAFNALPPSAPALLNERLELLAAEIDVAQGKRQAAWSKFEHVASKTRDSENGAIAYLRLTLIAHQLNQPATTESTVVALLTKFPSETQLADEAVGLWLTEFESASANTLLSVFEQLLERHKHHAFLGARVAVAFAKAQEAMGKPAAAVKTWRWITEAFPNERGIINKAFLRLAQAAEAAGNRSEALATYERVLREAANDPPVLRRAQAGLATLALEDAQAADRRARALNAGTERTSAQQEAYTLYGRLLHSNPRATFAQRRQIALAAELDTIAALTTDYEQLTQVEPKNPYAHYGLALSLCYHKHAPLQRIHTLLRKALTLEPRLGAAHLTLGWTYEQLERETPRQGFLEKALDAYSRAASIADAGAESVWSPGDKELWAAAQLNIGNAALGFGKFDLAFSSYLARELSGTPFNSKVSAHIFFERFARSAMAEEAYDVALDMAMRAYHASTHYRGRRAKLIAGISLLAGDPERAEHWYKKALDEHLPPTQTRQRSPALLGLGLAQQARGEFEAALQTFQNLLSALVTAAKAGVDESYIEPTLPGLQGRVDQIPANPNNVTRAPYGFSLAQEEQIVRHLTTKLSSTMGHEPKVLELSKIRLQLLQKEMQNEPQNQRLQRELAYTLHDHALLLSHAPTDSNAIPRATIQAYWLKAVQTLSTIRALGPLTSILFAITERTAAAPRLMDRQFSAALHDIVLPLVTPPQSTEESTEKITKAANTGSSVTRNTNNTGKNPERKNAPKAPFPSTTAALRKDPASLQLIHWLALHELQHALLPIPKPTYESTSATAPLEHALDVLDIDLASLRSAQNFAQQSMEKDGTPSPAAQHIAAILFGEAPDRDQDTSNTIFHNALLHSAVLNTPRCPTTDKLEPRANTAGPDATSMSSCPDTAASDKGRAALGSMLYSLYFKKIKSGELKPLQSALGETLIDQQRSLLMSPAHGSSESIGPRLWRILEQQRLLELPWPDQIRESHQSPRPYAKPAFLAFLSRTPTTEQAIRKTLGKRSILVQALRTTSAKSHEDTAFLWCLLSNTTPLWTLGSRRMPTPIEDALRALEPDGIETTYLDLQDLPFAARLAVSDFLHTDLGALEQVDTISATHLVTAAALQDISMQWERALQLPADTSPTQVKQSVQFLTTNAALSTSTELKLRGPAVLFQQGRAYSVHRLRTNAQSLVRIPDANALPCSAEPLTERLLLQHAALLAGIPSVVCTTMKGLNSFRQNLRSRLSEVASKNSNTTLAGFRGLEHRAQVEHAVQGYLPTAKLAISAYAKAARAPSVRAWRKAEHHLTMMFNYIEFLLRPENLAIVPTITHVLAKRLPSFLPGNLLTTGRKLASAKEALGDMQGRIALLQHLQRQPGASAKVQTELHLELGDVLLKTKQFKAAATQFTQCLATKDPGLEALATKCLMRQAALQRQTFSYADAITSYQQSIDRLRALKHPDIALAQRYLGFIYESNLANYDAALKTFEEAKATAQETVRRHGDKATKSELTLIRTLEVDQARVLRIRGDYEEALQKIASARLNGGTVVPSAILAAIDLETARIYWYRGNYRRALSAQRQSLKHALEIGDTFLEIQARSLGGLVALSQGDLKTARMRLREALRLAELSGRSTEEAVQLNNLGLVAQREGSIPAALELYRRAFAIDQRSNNAEGLAYDMRSLGDALLAAGQPAKALEHIDKALALSRKINNPYNEVRSLLLLGDILLELGKPGSAKAYRAAHMLALKLSVPEVRWQALFALGQLAEKGGEFVDASDLYERALKVALSLGRSRQQIGAGRSRRMLIDAARRLALRRKDLAAVVQYDELYRARHLLDRLSEVTLQFPSSDTATLLRAELFARERRDKAARNVRMHPDVTELGEVLTRMKKEYIVESERLHTKAPRLARILTMEISNLPAVQRSLGKNDLLLSYHFTADKLELLLIRQGSILSTSLTHDPEDLRTLIRNLQRDMQSLSPVASELQTLSNILLAPLRAVSKNANSTHNNTTILSTGRKPIAAGREPIDIIESGPTKKMRPHLIIVADGLLQQVPFAALPFSDGVLIEHYTLSQAASMSAHVETQSRLSPARTRQLLALSPAHDLPFSHLETESFSAIPGIHTRVYHLGAATREKLSESTADAWAIASHGVQHPNRAFASHLQLADGPLELREVFSLAPLPSLVTISACSVDMGTGSALPTAFLSAGSQTVITSRGRVSDLAAGIAMKWFYRYIAEGESRGEALRNSLLRLRKRFKHPQHWASFALFGDYR